MYKIYEFLSDKSIMALPISWIQNNLAPFSANAARFIKQNKKPLKTWQMYQVKEVDRKIYDSYSAALKAESILLDKSDLNTSDYEKCNKNMEQKGMEKGRKRKTLPAPQSSSTEEEGDESDDLPCVPVKRYASCHNSTQMLNAFNNKMSSTSADINQNQIMTSSYEVEMQTVVEDVPLQIITSPDVQGEHNITIDPSLLSCFNPAVNEQMIRQIIREELDAFENRILKRLEVRSGYITCKAKYIEFEEENKLPLKSIVELQEFDSNLKNDVSLQDKFKSYILQIDGTNAKESIKIINRIYHLDLQKQVSYTGREMKKYAVMSCEHIKIIIETVTEFFGISQKETIQLLQRFLQKTYDRVRSAKKKAIADSENEKENVV